MSQDHLVFKENLAAYALGSLDADEISALRDHLQTCDTCRAELADYQRVGAALLTALPPQAPRPGLKRALQKRLPVGTVRTRMPFKWSLSQIALAGVLTLLVGLNILTVSQVYSLKQEQAEITNQYISEQTAIAMLAYPSTKSLAFDQNGITGSLLIDKQRNLLAVFAWHLPIPPTGKAYQMWLIDPQGDRTNGGFITPESGYPFAMAVIKSPKSLTDFIGFGVTLEPFSGSTKPTGPRILRVDF
jgi:anti-sigma-K factor RskA